MEALGPAMTAEKAKEARAEKHKPEFAERSKAS
jgi:hypothetical protein